MSGDGASLRELENAARLATALDRVGKQQNAVPETVETQEDISDPTSKPDDLLSDAAETADVGPSLARRRRRASSVISTQPLRALRQRLSGSSPLSSSSSVFASSSSSPSPATNQTASEPARKSTMLKALSSAASSAASSSSSVNHSSKRRRRPPSAIQSKSTPTPPMMSRSNSFDSDRSADDDAPRVNLFPGPTAQEIEELKRAQHIGRIWHSIVVEENPDLKSAKTSVNRGKLETPSPSLLIAPTI